MPVNRCKNIVKPLLRKSPTETLQKFQKCHFLWQPSYDLATIQWSFYHRSKFHSTVTFIQFHEPNKFACCYGNYPYHLASWDNWYSAFSRFWVSLSSDAVNSVSHSRSTDKAGLAGLSRCSCWARCIRSSSVFDRSFLIGVIPVSGTENIRICKLFVANELLAKNKLFEEETIIVDVWQGLTYIKVRTTNLWCQFMEDIYILIFVQYLS